MRNRVNEAVQLFDEGFVCSQAIFATYCDEYGLERNIALKIANGFGGGIARKQEICGVVSGAIMLIGLKYGKTESSDSKAHENTYRIINYYCERFIERNHSTNCCELLGGDLRNANEKGLFGTLCRKYVKDSAEIIEILLADNKI
jgi:C_GCAxxG_C_C family probable redox protein